MDRFRFRFSGKEKEATTSVQLRSAWTTERSARQVRLFFCTAPAAGKGGRTLGARVDDAASLFFFSFPFLLVFLPRLFH